MPFTRIAVKKGTSPEKRTTIAHGVHQAMVDNIGIPQEDCFQLISDYVQDVIRQRTLSV